MLYLCLIKFWMQSYEIYFKIVCFKAEKMQTTFYVVPRAIYLPQRAA